MAESPPTRLNTSAPASRRILVLKTSLPGLPPYFLQLVVQRLLIDAENFSAGARVRLFFV